jgi:outer membrane lipoprotein-sorting protein
MKSVRDIDKRVRQLHRPASDDLNVRVHADIDQALADEQTTTTSTKGRIIMASPITKLAVAAAVVFAGLLGLNIFNSPHAGGVAWAGIPDRVKAIDTFMFRLTISARGKDGKSVSDEHTGQFTFYLSEQYGFRMDIGGAGQVVSWYVPPEADTITMVIPGARKWSQSPLPPEQRGKMPEQYRDPAEYIQRFMARPYKELGRSVIDGIEVEGIEVQDPPTDGGTLENGVGRMWVDVRTELPVRIELEGTADERAVSWLMEFKWSEAVAAAVFEPNIPSDYTPLTQ